MKIPNATFEVTVPSPFLHCYDFVWLGWDKLALNFRAVVKQGLQILASKIDLQRRWTPGWSWSNLFGDEKSKWSNGSLGRSWHPISVCSLTLEASMILPTYPRKIPHSSPNSHKYKQSFRNCCLRSAPGIFQGLCGWNLRNQPSKRKNCRSLFCGPPAKKPTGGVPFANGETHTFPNPVSRFRFLKVHCELVPPWNVDLRGYQVQLIR